MRSRLVTPLLVLAVVGVVTAAFVVAGGAEFGGSDGAAADAVTTTAPHYEPWFESVWAPGSAEVESGLFALQAALGAGVLGFVLGVLRERRRRADR